MAGQPGATDVIFATHGDMIGCLTSEIDWIVALSNTNQIYCIDIANRLRLDNC